MFAILDNLETELQKEVKKMRIETPIGNLESDSGSHLVDVGSIFILAVSLYLIKRIIDKFLK